MERMLVVVFDNEKKAYEGKSALGQLQAEGNLTIYQEAVILKHADGTVSVKQVDDSAPVGTLTGTAVGGLIGAAGRTGGDGPSAPPPARGSACSTTPTRSRLARISSRTSSKSLAPNKVAVVAEVDEAWTTPVDTRMEALGGTVFRRALWAVQEQVRREEIAAMKADLAELKSEASKANAERKAKLQKKIEQLAGKIDAQDKKLTERIGCVRGAPEGEEGDSPEERRSRRPGAQESGEHKRLTQLI